MWSAFLTRNDLFNINNLPKELNNESLKKALTVLNVMNFNPEEREFYEDHLKWLRIEANTLKKMREESLAEGIEKGIENTAINMLKAKLDDQLIKSVTGFSQEILDKLKNKR